METVAGVLRSYRCSLSRQPAGRWPLGGRVPDDLLDAVVAGVVNVISA
jgi:hypothetical protein